MNIARLMQMARAGVPAGGGDVWTDPDLANASYDSVSFSVAGQETTPTSVKFKSDGTKMYVVGAGTDAIYQYSLSTAWDISTASYDSVSFSISSQDTAPLSVFFRDDGSKMYVSGNTNDAVFSYTLSSAWDISTASYDSVSFSVSSQDNQPASFYFKSDGTKMYILGNLNDSVFSYTLSSAWDISTASYDSVSFSVSSQDNQPASFYFKSDGTKMYILGNLNDSVFSYTLSSAWDISTASYDSVSFSVSSQEAVPYSLFFKSDGSKMYVVGAGTDTIYQYSTD